MLQSLPAELLLQILSYLVADLPSSTVPSALNPLSSTSSSLNTSTRDYRAHLLRTRISGIPNISTLMSVWTPPTFFRRERGYWQSSGGFAQRPSDLHDLLEDPTLYSNIDSYLSSLEGKNYIIARVALYLSRSLSWPVSTIEAYLMHLWRAQEFYSHDVDRIWGLSSLGGGASGEHILRKEARVGFAQGLGDTTVDAMIRIYDALDAVLRPPTGGQEWLFRVIVREGLEMIWGWLQHR